MAIPDIAGGPRAAIGKATRQLGNLFVVGKQNPALSGGDVLAHLEAECAAIADRSSAIAFPLRAPTMTGILDDTQPIFSTEGLVSVHVYGDTTEMHWEDGFCF